MPRKVRGLGCGVCHGLTDTIPPGPPGLPGHLAVLCCSHVLLRHEDHCGSCESQSYSFSSVDTPQLFLPGTLCFPRAKPGNHPSLGPWNLSLPPDLFLKDILLLPLNSVFPLGVRLLGKKSQEVLQLGLASTTLSE